MGLSQSLSTGITGLMSHQKAMDNLGNNLANVNTTGFKQGVYQFSNLLQQSLRGGMAADGTTGRGSVNPISMGMGTQTASINKVFTQGNLENTSNPYDLGINGNGFFVVRQGNGYAYTREGSFARSSDGYLINHSGLYVQGTMAVRQADGTYKIPADAKMQDINIPLGSVGGHVQTTEGSFTGNLNSKQSVAGGLNLFGSNSYPSVNNIQAWMPKEFNGGTSNKTDTSWSVLQESSYAVSKTTLDSWGMTQDELEERLKGTGIKVSVYGAGVVTDIPAGGERSCYYYLNGDGEVVGDGETLFSAADVAAGGGIPLVQEVNTVNGGNVQSSAEFAIRVKDEEAPDGYVMKPASLDTDLKDLWYKKGDSWVQPFANISNGEEINLSFSKGDSQAECAFVYNVPASAPIVPGQIAVNQEKSHTLEHFLIFMAGDVDKPMTVCQNISPEMFGWEDRQNFDPPQDPMGDDEWDSAGYQAALTNSKLASAANNLDSSGGALGLLSIPPRISDKNGGTAAYDVPGETAGAFTRVGEDGRFYVSLVSNLGTQNDLSDIKVSYKDVPHETMFSDDTDYAAPQGGSAMVSVDYYDSLGNPKTAVVRMAMVDQDDNFTTWRWYADSADDSDFAWQADGDGNINTSFSVGTGIIRFDKDGNYVAGSEHSETNGITIDLRSQGVNNPIWVKVQNGLSTSKNQNLDFSDVTCTASSADNNTIREETQNGRPPSVLDEFAIGQDGTIQGVYKNGSVVILARIGMATVPNETGLISAAGNLFYAGPASGDPQYGHAGTAGMGTLNQYMLETSNVELAVEFTKLITIERGFQANSRTITTADEMIQELLNLKR